MGSALEPAPLPRRERRQGSNTSKSPASKAQSTLGDTPAATYGARHKTAGNPDVPQQHDHRWRDPRAGVSLGHAQSSATAVVYRLGEGLLLAVRSAGRKNTNWAGVSLGHAHFAATAVVYRLPREGVAVAGSAVGRQKIDTLGGVDRSILGPSSR